MLYFANTTNLRIDFLLFAFVVDVVVQNLPIKVADSCNENNDACEGATQSRDNFWE